VATGYSALRRLPGLSGNGRVPSALELRRQQSLPCKFGCCTHIGRRGGAIKISMAVVDLLIFYFPFEKVAFFYFALVKSAVVDF
jgi:hypothetical protein